MSGLTRPIGKDIGKSRFWVQSNELGRSDYKFSDLKKLVQKNDIEILIVDKSEAKKDYIPN